MRKKIGIIASDIELKERIEELYREDVENGTIIIDILNLDLMENQGRILVEKGAQAIIGRGGGYSLVIDTVNVPVIPMNMKSTDLLRAIEIAKKYSKKVVLILGDNEVSFDYVGWRNVISTEITEEWFESKYEIRSKVVKYIDIPIQHISNHVLKLMARKTTKEHIMDKIKMLRTRVPEIIIRTTFIVGFPQETQEDFEEITDFLEEFKLDKVGVFTYSQEEDTAAARMEGQIEEEIKKVREEKLMLTQKCVSEELNKLKIGKYYDILVEGYNGEYYHGRSFEMAPDIDGNIFFKNNDNANIEIGSFVKVKIIENMDYDLIGVVVNESCK